MLNFSAARIYLCLEPTDMRKSFDTLAALVREQLQGVAGSERSNGTGRHVSDSTHE